ncbi:MAG: hypothetical protein EOP47_19375, partial [Sphingobacteriaceae bacterium]
VDAGIGRRRVGRKQATIRIQRQPGRVGDHLTVEADRHRVGQVGGRRFQVVEVAITNRHAERRADLYRHIGVCLTDDEERGGVGGGAWIRRRVFIYVSDIDGDGMADLVSAQQSISYNRNNPLAPPIVTSFKPWSINTVGSELNVIGENFSKEQANNKVYFGSVKAEVLSSSRKSITVKIPAGPAYEKITVVNKDKNLEATSPYPFAPMYLSNFEITANYFKTKFDLTTAAAPSSNAIGDLNGDDKPDLVVTNRVDNTINVYRNISPTGSLTAASFAPMVVFNVGKGPASVIIKDINNDGKPEIITANIESNTVSILNNAITNGDITTSAFAAKVDFATGSKPVKVITADINMDGRPDIITVSNSADIFSVLINTTTLGTVSAGSFTGKVDFATSNKPSSIIAADANYDGKTDIVVSNAGSTTISVFLNTTVMAPSFKPKLNISTGANPSDIAIGTYSNWEGLFFAVTNKGSNTVSIHTLRFYGGDVPQIINKGSFATGKSPVELRLADIDGDGVLDAAVLNAADNTISLLRGKGFGGPFNSEEFSFEPKVDISTGSSPAGLNICDLDNDLKPDLIIGSTDSASLKMIRNYRVETPTIITSFTPQTGVAGTEITINGNGFDATAANNTVFFGPVKADIVKSTVSKLIVKVPVGAAFCPLSVSNTTTNRIGFTNGTFAPTFVNRGGLAAVDFEDKFQIYSSEYTPTTSVGDFNQDGKPDIVVNNRFLNNVSEKGTLNSGSFIKKEIAYTGGTTSIDFNADGKLDVFQPGSGFSLNKSPLGVDVPVFDDRVGLGGLVIDVDNDGKPDIVNIGQSKDVYIYRNISTSPNEVRLASAITIKAAFDQYSTTYNVTDIDGDGKTDVLLINMQKGTLGVLRNITPIGGTPAFADKIEFSTGVLGIKGTYFADINNDGKNDMIVTRSDNKGFSVFRNIYESGKLSLFAPKVDFPLYNPTEYSLHQFKLAFNDMNGDGKTDIIATLYITYDNTGLENLTGVTLFLNKSTDNNITSDSFVAQPKLKTGNLYGETNVADFDGDGRPDLLINSGRTVSLMRNNPFVLPVITSINPISGDVGSSVLISGKGFSVTPSKNIVRFGAVNATVKAATDTTITITVPVGATYRPVTVLNTDKQLTATAVTPFTTTFLTDRNFTADTFTQKLTAPTGTKPGNSSTGDFDGDGKLEIAVVNATSRTLSIFSGSSRIDLKTGAEPSFVSITDLDNDGKPDIVVS